jgi:hypothetical protein
MSEGMLFRVHRSQADIVAETVEAWKGEHDRAMRARDVEDAVLLCLDYPAQMGRLWKTTWKHIEDGTMGVNAAWYALQATFTRTLDVMDGVRELVRAAAAAGHTVEGAAELEQARDRVAALKDDIFRHWEPFTEETAREALEASARGECLELDEAFAAIAGVDKETWLRRVAEYREAKEKKRRQEGNGDGLQG